MEAPKTTEQVEAPQRHGLYRSITDILNDFKDPVPTAYIKSKVIKGSKIDYVPHTTLRKALDHYAPGWEWTETPFFADGKLYVTGTLAIRGYDADGSLVRITREALGNEDSDLDGYGDPSSNASAQALRRAFQLGFGWGRSMWEKK